MAWPCAARGTLLAASLLVAGLPAFAAPGPLPSLREVAFLTSSSAASPHPWQAFDGSNLVLADIDGDGLPEIVGSNDDLRHYVIDPRLGEVVAEMSGTHAGGDGWAGRELNGPAVGDLFGDGRMDVVIDDGDSYLSAWQYDPDNSTGSHDAMTKLWERYVDARAWVPDFNDTHPFNQEDLPASEAHPYLADVDGHGQLTVFAQADNVAAHAAFWPNGTLRWFDAPGVDSNAGVVVADLDGRGKLVAVFASDGGIVYAKDARSGKPLWTFDTRCEGGVWRDGGSNCDWQEPGSVTLSPTIADLLGDGKKEICFGTRVPVPISDPGWYHNNTTIQANVDASHGKLWCLTHDGHLLWMQQFPFSNPHTSMHPVPFDVDGDGVRDLLWIDWNTIGHIPGNYQTTTRGPNLMALDGHNGSLLWRTTLRSGWSNKDLSLLDVFGNGRQLIIAEEFGPTGDDGISLIDPHQGTRVAWYPLERGWVATRGPLVGDLLGDGRAQLIVPVTRWHNATDGYCPQVRVDLACREGAIEVLATGQPFRSAFTDSFTWNLALDAHVFDLVEHPQAAQPAAWPGQEHAPLVQAYTTTGRVVLPAASSGSPSKPDARPTDASAVPIPSNDAPSPFEGPPADEPAVAPHGDANAPLSAGTDGTGVDVMGALSSAGIGLGLAGALVLVGGWLILRRLRKAQG